MSLYELNINFDEASKMWRQNKKTIGNGTFTYICCGLNNIPCNNKPKANYNYCLNHLKSMKKNNICTMKTINGKKCKKISMNGFNYCFSHNLQKK